MYIPLNVKTHYELLSSLIKIDELVLYAKNNNIEAIGITDSNMFGCLEFYNLCRENNIKPIIGIEVNLNYMDFYLYAKNYNGYVNLCNIVSIKNTSSLSEDVLVEKSDDLICVCNSKYFNKLSCIYENVFISFKNDNEYLEAMTFTSNVVYMNKVLYINKCDKEYLSYLYMIKDSKTIKDNVLYNFDNALEDDIKPSYVETTRSFSDLINIKLPKYDFDLPIYREDAESFLDSLCRRGLEKRRCVSKKYVDRIRYELSVIKKMGFVNYFLIVYDFVLYAKKHNILVGPGRGSAAGSLVSYALGITDIDPLKYDLIFERFLNPDRITMPDIDIDFDYLRRNEVVNYVKNKYGLDKVANIITFGTLLPKQVLRDVGRVMDISITEIDKITKFINEDSFKKLENNKLFMNVINSKSEYQKLYRVSKKLENLKRHTSIHAAGIVISKNSLMNKMPLIKSGESLLTGYTMEYMETLGLLKMDFLALRNLSVIDSVIKLVYENTGVKVSLSDIPLDDKETISLFNKADTIGIFQFEKEGMKNFLKTLNVRTFEDIVSAIALYRPGPRENIPSFIRRKEGKEKITYLIPELEPILKNTYGIIIYQEQIIEILKRIGGFTYSEADNIRRAMSKKKMDTIKKYEHLFITGAKNNGINEAKSNELYQLVLKFANYGFNKSHSVAYSMIAFYMGYLKSNYKEYFMINLLNMVLGSEEKTKEYIDESKLLGLEIEFPNINKSTNEYKIIDGKIVLPLSAIKNVGGISCNEILEIRNKEGEFTDYIDFVKKVYSSKVNTKVIESLIDSGALDIFKLTRKSMHLSLNDIINYSELCKSIDVSLIEKPNIIYEEEFDKNELIEREYKLYGFYLNNHPVTKYRREINLNKIDEHFDKVVSVIGMIEYIKEIKTKKGDAMAFVTISDEYKKMTVVVFSNIYEDNLSIKKGDIIKIIGRVEKRMSDFQIVAKRIEKLNF